ncbi:iron-hydroxamate ABC transporter substrate-binding protein [Paenibacillus chitinolyticus]|uniref:iron-hydroxamate ABC transporter substrate-binding protein n=1 Tax=Paenibacillus chitinolyticus TaxID=79263 RepID=UPI00366CB842
MKKKLLLPLLLLLVMSVISACGNKAANDKQAGSVSSNAGQAANSATNSDTASKPKAGTKTYQSESGPIEVPANPKRIVALTNAPNVLSLNGTLVGVDEWTNKNPLFTGKLSGVKVVSPDNLEKIIELDPDLIITGTDTKNLDKLKEIAPTVAYTWGKLDYLNQQMEIGKLLNKERETQAWIDDFKQRAAEVGKEIKAKFGDNVSVSVIETDSKSFYVFGNKWARGTEVLYQAMGLSMPEKVKADAMGPGYYMLSSEVLGDYAGDFLVLSRSSKGDNSFMKTATWNNIPAVKNKHVIEIDMESSTYSDPTTLEYLLGIFKTAFLQ